MITSYSSCDQPQKNWQHSLAQAITDPSELLRQLKLPDTLLKSAQLAAAQFPLRVTPHYLGLIEPEDPDDPLLRQILPLGQELAITPGYHLDPVNDTAASNGQGVLQKYSGRALLITTGACAIHCRYCFRRHYAYAENTLLRHWQAALKQLQEKVEITEVILSGGDPLSLSDERLFGLVKQIGAIPHIRRLRLHSRLPIAVPERLTQKLLACLSDTRLQTSLVIHCNHPNELHHELRPGLDGLRSAGVILLNQSVLLAGVNDCAKTLQQLSEDLFSYGVLPYYLHLLDPVQGAAHFAVGEHKVAAIQDKLSHQLPGYLVPRIVTEIPGEQAKTVWRG